MRTKLLSMLLCGCLMAGCLIGCADAGTPDVSGTPEEGYLPDAVVMTINGLDVTWEEYYYWLYDAVAATEYYVGEITDWDAASGIDATQTNREFIESYALDALKQYRAIEHRAAELKVELTEEDKQYLQELWDSDVASYGGGDEAAFLEYLESSSVSKELYDSFNETALLYMGCFNELYGVNGAACPDADTVKYAEEMGYMQVKHILISTMDDAGEALSEELAAEKLAQANGIIETLKGKEDTEAGFDELMLEYSEDPGLAYYPGGYCFMDDGKMIPAFTEASKSLEIGEFTQEPVLGTSGYHIILRLPIDPDAVLEYYSASEAYTLRNDAAMSLYDKDVGKWIDDTVIEYSPAFKDLDITTLF